MSKKEESNNDELKSMIEKLIEEVGDLKDRIKKLEKSNKYYDPYGNDPHPQKKRERTCPTCNGTGKVKDWSPYKFPYYGVE